LINVVDVVTADAGRTLHERALTGDEDAFDALIGPLVEPAIRLAYSMLGNRTEAEDATQEAVTRAWRKLGQLRAGMPVRPWFLAIVVNQCRNVRRTRWFRFVRTTGTVQAGPHPEPDAGRIDIARAISRLSDSDRQALFLHFYLDLPVEEVGTALGISAAAAKGRIYRACRRLRPGLVEEDL
jgi:RNA polymerase sigma-70 factor, ECF subfamily